MISEFQIDPFRDLTVTLDGNFFSFLHILGRDFFTICNPNTDSDNFCLIR